MSILSERGYFSLRYAVPGFTLILLVLGINYAPLTVLLNNLNNVDFGTFLAFFSLLSGSAIGFLVTQIYWFLFQKKKGILGIDKPKLFGDYGPEFPGDYGPEETFEEYRPEKIVIKVLCEKYDLNEDTLSDITNENEQRKLVAVLDYISHSEGDNRRFTLMTRRWDMYHLLESTRYTLGIGTFFGGILRSIVCFGFKGYYGPFCHVEFLILVPIGILVLILNCILHKSKNWVIGEHIYLLEARIRMSTVTITDLVNAFPNFIPQYSEIDFINQM